MKRPKRKMMRLFRNRIHNEISKAGFGKHSSTIYFWNQIVFKKNGNKMTAKDLFRMSDKKVLKCVIRSLHEGDAQ